MLNQGGRVESAGQLTLHARTLDNQNGTLLGLQALTLSAQQDYIHQAGETISSNGTVTFSLSGAYQPGGLVAARQAGAPCRQHHQSGGAGGQNAAADDRALQNTGRLEADSMTLNVDTGQRRGADGRRHHRERAHYRQPRCACGDGGDPQPDGAGR
ncbi:hypothetical protein M8494_08850 [Serratia ureilytica]